MYAPEVVVPTKDFVQEVAKSNEAMVRDYLYRLNIRVFFDARDRGHCEFDGGYPLNARTHLILI